MIDAYIIGSEKVIRKFDAFPAKLQAQLKVAITRLTIKLQTYVKNQKLSGQVLNVRTGRLRGSIDQLVTETSDSIIGKVSTNVSYGKKHEYGFTGIETVGAHLRRITKAWGRTIMPKEVMVRSYTRRVDLPERSFLRSALRDFVENGQIITELEAAVKRAES